MSPNLQAGLSFTWTYQVPERATVPQLYNDTWFCREMPSILATGYMVGLMELACMDAIMPYLDWPHEQTLGTKVCFTHLAASLPGMLLTITGKLLSIEGRLLDFEVSAWDGIDKVSEGRHERMVVQSQRFQSKLEQKKQRVLKKE